MVGSVFAAMYVGHMVGDHWAQTNRQALRKILPGWPGWRACNAHVTVLTIIQGLTLASLMISTGWEPDYLHLWVGLSVNYLSHYVADRRWPLHAIARVLGKGEFYALGDPVEAPCGTGAYAMDQSWHIAWLWITTLIICA